MVKLPVTRDFVKIFFVLKQRSAINSTFFKSKILLLMIIQVMDIVIRLFDEIELMDKIDQ